jgi:hypothetical protein
MKGGLQSAVQNISSALIHNEDEMIVAARQRFENFMAIVMLIVEETAR